MGANVFVTARREKLLQEVVDTCKSLGKDGSQYGFITADMADSDSVAQVIPAAVKHLGTLDYLILNHALADGSQWGFLADKLKNFQQIKTEFDINFFSYLQLTSDALPHLLGSQGRVGVMSSILGRHPMIDLGVTAASKHALEGFFQTLDIENHFRETGVSFTMIAPGPVVTSAFDAAPASFEKEGIDMQKYVEFLNPPVDPKEVGYEIIRATALRKVEIYCPNTWDVWENAVLKNFVPSIFRDSVRSLKRKPAK